MWLDEYPLKNFVYCITYKYSCKYRRCPSSVVFCYTMLTDQHTMYIGVCEYKSTSFCNGVPNSSARSCIIKCKLCITENS